MIKNIRSYIALIAVALLLFSCAKEEAQEGSQPVPIKLTAASLGTDTRAVDGINDTNFPFETPITVAVDGTNYGYKTDATSISDPMVCQETASPYFPVNGNSVHVVAYHPASVQYATTNQTFTVAADQSTAAGYKASDLMVGLPQATFQDGSGNSLIEGSGMTCKVKRTSIPIPLEFEHKLSKIKVNVTINGAIVKSVTMKNIKRSADFNPSTAVLSNVAAVATTGLDNVIMYSDFTGTSTDFTTAAIIPEQNPADGTEFIDVVIQDSPSDKTLTYKLQDDGDFESGKQYIYNLTVNNDEILCTTTITDWDTAVNGTDFTHGDGLALSRPVMPIEYLIGATNMAATADDISGNVYIGTIHRMASDNTPRKTAYFRWSTAATAFKHTQVVEPDGISVGSYHLAMTKEWMSIIPPGYVGNNNPLSGALTISGTNNDRIVFGTNVQHMNMQESVAWGAVWNGTSYTYQVDRIFKNDYYCPSGTTIGYGLRFKEDSGNNGEYTCAYRYEYTASESSVGGGAAWIIKSKYVGRNPAITLSTISNEAWWAEDTETVIFPATGIAWPDENNYDYPSGTYSTDVINDKGWSWELTIDEYDSSIQGYTVLLKNDLMCGNNTSRKAYSIPVRLFRDAE